MSLSILNNIPSLEAQNQLATTNMNLQNTLFQLSSGSKINSGADDPAGLSIADGLQANISALAQSAQNVTDGVGMLQTADGALSQVTTLLNRAVTLATEAGNAGLTTDQQGALQTEFASITKEINQIGANTTYNNTPILTGNAIQVFLSDGSDKDFQNASTGNAASISVSMQALSSTALGFNSYATGTIDLTANPNVGDTVQIGHTTYTFVAPASMSSAPLNSVAINASGVQATLQNLQAAVNGGAGAGQAYSAGTVANGDAQITSVNGGSAIVQATAPGADGNTVPLVANLTANVDGPTLTGGTNATPDTGTLTFGSTQPGTITTATGTLTMTARPDTITAATGIINLNGAQPLAGNSTGTLTLGVLPTDGDQVTVGTQTYTFKNVAAGANQVGIDGGSDIGITLQNLADAVNGTANANNGTTTAAGSALITNVDTVNDVATVVAWTPGAAGDAVPLAANPQNPGDSTVTAMTGGATSDTLTVGNTTYTFVAAGAAVAAGEVALGATRADTLTNLMDAVNGVGNGTLATYGSGTASAGSVHMDYPGAGDVAIFTATNGGAAGNGTALSALGTIANDVAPNGLTGGADADTVQVGGQTYTFVAAGQAVLANEVSVAFTGNTAQDLAADIQTTLTNLAGAVNGLAGNVNGTTWGLNTQGATTALMTLGATAGVANVTAVAQGAPGDNVNFSATSPTNTTTVSGTVTNKLSGGFDADTVQIGAVTYKFVVAAGQTLAANEVALGATAQKTMDNLMAAVNSTASTAAYDATTNPGGWGNTTFGHNTTLQDAATGASITADANGIATVTANTPGNLGVNAPLLTASGTLASAVTHVDGSNELMSGVVAGKSSGNLTLNINPHAGNTVTIGSDVYTFVNGAPVTGSVNTVELGADTNATLTNLEAAVNASGGTHYGSGTVQNVQATITSVSGGNAVVQARTAGAGATGQETGNFITLGAAISNGASGGVVGGGATLNNGAGAVDLTSPANSQAALNIITKAIATVASARGAIGAGINQMNAALNVMNNTSQNLTSSLSGIKDANIGQVVANMSKYQVLEQTGIAALAQSNSQEQAVLKLLQ